MTENDSIQTLGLVQKLWPKTVTGWPDEMSAEFMVACERIPIDWAQADAAIKALAMRSKFATIKPVEALEALRNAVARVAEERRQTGATRTLDDVDAMLRDVPPNLRHEVLLRVDGNLPPLEARGALAGNLANAALLAETDWNAALEWPLFRDAVRTTPSVRKWIDGRN